MRENTNGKIRVLLADAHTMFREGLEAILSSRADLEVVGAVTNDGQVPRLARELRPDVVVTEVQVPLEKAKKILGAMRSSPDPPEVVICTMFDIPRYMRGLIGSGASAYVLKSSSSEHLVAAVRAAVVNPRGTDGVLGEMPRSMSGRAEKVAEGILSARELEVLLLASRGLSNARIASSLSISEGTVKRHLANVYEKMEVSSRSEAAKEALAKGWIIPEDLLAEKPGV